MLLLCENSYHTRIFITIIIYIFKHNIYKENQNVK